MVGLDPCGCIACFNDRNDQKYWMRRLEKHYNKTGKVNHEFSDKVAKLKSDLKERHK